MAIDLYFSLTLTNFRSAGSQFFPYHPLPKERKPVERNSLELNPGRLAPHTTALTTGPWLVSCGIYKIEKSKDAAVEF